LAILSLLALGILAEAPIGDWLIRPLEDRFPPPPADIAPPDGIIVLGGAINDSVSRSRGQIAFDEGERVVEAAILARRYPHARLIFSGGNGSLSATASTEAQQAEKLWIALGVDPSRILLEDRSRNTDENARFTGALLHPEPSQRWLLVTSAFHMPRSMGLFEKAGFNAVAFPVGYKTPRPGEAVFWTLDPARNLRVLETAMKEWIGLPTYWLTGRIDQVFPGPRDVAPAASGA
jgi:uncharacterized SAM-binding protein YcdF (DUF218 family)